MQYEELMAESAMADVRLVAITPPGQGGRPALDDDSVENYAQLISELAAHLGCDAVVGFSMGGAFALSIAALVPEVRACVSFYGAPWPGTVDLSKIRARVLGHYVQVDHHVSPERLAQVEAELRSADTPFTLHRYDAQHSFFNEQIDGVYSAEASALAWERTIAFLNEALGEDRR